MLRCLLAFPLLLAFSTPALSEEIRDAGPLPPHVAMDASAPAVTEANLLQSERFWPYRVALAKRDLASKLAPGSEGVLVRVEEGARARIDFGRDGVHTLPVAITNLVDEANRVRLGEIPKISPNLILAIGPRLNGAAMGKLRLPLTELSGRQGFLAVFADPKSEAFDAIAKALARFQDRDGVMTVLFPQSLVNENTFGARMAALGWHVPYVYDYLAGGYTDALLGDPAGTPAVSLHTAEGRLLLQQPWSPESVDAIGEALERNFPAPAVAQAEGTARPPQ
jgi:hypothetical protein